MPKDISTTTTDFTKLQSTSQLDKEPRGVLNKLNRLFSQNEPVMGYGDNVVVPVSPPVLNRRRIVPAFNSYNYDYYDDAGQNNNRQNLVVQNNMNKNGFQDIGNIDYFDGRCILTVTNDQADTINDRVTQLLPLDCFMVLPL